VIHVSIQGVDLTLKTAESLFSPRRVDPGTLAMLSCVRFLKNDKVLDLGCGYGVVGILAAKVVAPERVYMIDNDPVAVELASENVRLNDAQGITVLLSDGFDALTAAGFTHILCNPPYHVDFSVPKRFIRKGFNRLLVGGRFWLVTQREVWYRNKLRAIFGGVTEHDAAPYRVFEAIKRSHRYANAV
jgi:16S rRNA (guanine1207-N2)-methyltransferase